MHKWDVRVGMLVRGALDGYDYILLTSQPSPEEDWQRKRIGRLMSGQVAVVLEVAEAEVRIMTPDGPGWIWMWNLREVKT